MQASQITWKKVVIRWCVPLLILGPLVVFAWKYGGNLSVIQKANPFYLLLAAGVFIFTRSLNGQVLRIALRRLRRNLSFRWAFLLTMAMSYINLLVPRAGLGAPALFLRRRHNLRYSSFAALLVPLLVVQLLCAGLIGLALTAILQYSGSVSNWFLWYAIFAAVAAGAVGLMLFPIPGSLSGDGKFIRAIRRFRRIRPFMYSSPGVVLRPMAVHAVIIILRGLRMALVFEALGGGNWPAVFMVSIFSQFTILLGVTPNGLGLKEAVIMLSYPALVPGGGALALSAAILDRMVMMAVEIVVGQYALRRMLGELGIAKVGVISRRYQSPLPLLRQPIPELPGWVKIRRALPWIVLAVVATYLFAVNSYWHFGEDSSLYQILARNLQLGRGYTIAGIPHAKVPPGFAFLLTALVPADAQLSQFLWCNFAMAAFGLLACYVGYRLMRHLIHPQWAVLMGLFMLVNYAVFKRTTDVITDLPCALLVFGAILCFVRGALVPARQLIMWSAASVLLVAAVWMRLAVLPMIPAAGLAMLLTSWKHRRKTALASVAMLAALTAATLAVFYAQYRTASATGITASYLHHFSSIADRASNAMFNCLRGIQECGRILCGQRLPIWLTPILVGAPLIAGTYQRLRRGQWFVILIFWSYLLSISFITARIIPRYLLLVMPLLLVLFLDGVAVLLGAIKQLDRKQAATAMLILIGVLFAFHIPRDIDFLIEKKGIGNYLTEQQDGRFAHLADVVEELNRLPAPARGNVFCDNITAYVADVPSPRLPKKLMRHSPSDEKIESVLDTLDIGRAVCRQDEKLTGETERFAKALQRYLIARPQTWQARTIGPVNVYRMRSVTDGQTPAEDVK